MRISDWSSDVCSSDLSGGRCFFEDPFGVISMLKACSTTGAHRSSRTPDGEHCHRGGDDPHRSAQIGRASCRERVCQYVSISVVAVSLKKKNETREWNASMSIDRSSITTKI